MDLYSPNLNLTEDLEKLNSDIMSAYRIDDEKYAHVDVKRGLRNSDGTGVIIGVTGVGSVQGYTVVDGERIPMPGKLYYRGINSTDIVEANLKAGTFGYEEAVYLLLLGELPQSQSFQPQHGGVGGRSVIRATQHHGQGDVFDGRQFRQQLSGLEDEAEGAAAQFGAVSVAQPR